METTYVFRRDWIETIFSLPMVSLDHQMEFQLLSRTVILRLQVFSCMYRK